MVCRILVADDSSTIQKVIKIGLANLPNDIRAVSSIQDALKAAHPGQIDLIIAGAGLPGVSMAADFKKLADQAGGIPIVVLMGSYDAVREADLRVAGIQHIMKKPFPPGDLARLVQELVVLTRQSSSVQSDFSLENPQAVASFNLSSANTSPQLKLPDPPSMGFDQDTIAKSIPEAIPQTFPYGGVSSFDLGSDFSGNTGTGKVPPTPELEPGRKGRPAFDLGDSAEGATAAPFSPPLSQSLQRPDLNINSPAPEPSSSRQLAGMSAAVEAFVLNELPPLVDRAVERYCVEHFKQIAREALTAELRRLAEEKARFLVDQ